MIMETIDRHIKTVFVLDQASTQIAADSIRNFIHTYWDEISEKKNILIIKPKGRFPLQFPESMCIEY